MLFGSCDCGECSISVDEQYLKFAFASCHCTRCRKVSSSPFTIWSGIAVENTKHFHVNVASSIGKYNTTKNCCRYFCKTCSCQLYIQYESGTDERWSGEIHFPTAILTDESVSLAERVRKCKLLYLLLLLLIGNGKARKTAIFACVLLKSIALLKRCECMGSCFKIWG